MRKKTIIQLIEENEFNVSILYSLYAKKIPKKGRFWKQLSTEEISHAASIGSERSDKETDLFKENKFSHTITAYVMNFVIDEINKAKEAEKINHKEALLIALRIERSMLEKKCFDIFSPTNKKLKRILKKLNDETEQHIQILIKEMQRIKNSS